jgi:hypothetical protein
MTNMTPPTPRADWGFGLRWAMATAVGWLVGFVICEAFKAFFRSISSDGAVIGTCVGIAQWLVIRPRISGTRWWIGASIVGFAFGKLVGDLVVAQTGIENSLITGLGGAIIGASLGLAQWLVLRRYVAQAGWWVAASAVAWAIAWIIISWGGERAGEAVGEVVVTPASAYLVGLMGAFVAGLISGVALIRLFRARPA